MEIPAARLKVLPQELIDDGIELHETGVLTEVVLKRTGKRI